MRLFSFVGYGLALVVLGAYDSYPGRLHSKAAARKIKVADSLRQSARETLIVE